LTLKAKRFTLIWREELGDEPADVTAKYEILIHKTFISRRFNGDAN
jgi:hypothetical protein